MKVVPILAMQNANVKGSPLEDLEKLKKKLDLKFWVAKYTMKADFSFDAEFENYDLEPCEYSSYFEDKRWQKNFAYYEKSEGKPSYFFCPSKEAIEVEISSSNTVPRKEGDQIVQAGFNIYRCSGNECASKVDIDKAITDTYVKMILFTPMNQMQLHLDGPPYTYVSEWIVG